MVLERKIRQTHTQGHAGEEPTGEPMTFKAPDGRQKSPSIKGSQKQKEPIEEPTNAENKNGHLMSDRKSLIYLEPTRGIEPRTYGLQIRCSAN